MGLSSVVLLVFLQLILPGLCQVEDCGGTSNYTDTSTGLAWVSDAGFTRHGKVAKVQSSSEHRQQYQLHRYFPNDSRKYCYTLWTTQSRRYLVRATFLYGGSDSESSYPDFHLYLDCTQWSTIRIIDPSRIYVEEMIIRAASTSIEVCLCCASAGYPFISTLELRPLNTSMYVTDYEKDFYLQVSARVNFGAMSKDPIRYPDDPYDRIWASDIDRRQNYLVDVAGGTEKISTTRNIKTNMREHPPVKVMQTAVVGTLGVLSYRLDLYGFPANARAYAYLAEIEDLAVNETRKFTLQKPHIPGYSNAVVDIAENANGSYILYEPSFMNVSLDFVLSFSLLKTKGSTRGPLLNAIEFSKYVQIIQMTEAQDIMVLDAIRSLSSEGNWRSEDGDPCLPSQWTWLNCSSSTPPRITRMWLDGNSLTGPIPDMSNLIRLTIMHLENNKLTGQIPSYLGDLPSLKELYDGNPELKLRNHGKNLKLVIGMAAGALFVFAILLWGIVFLWRNFRRKALRDNERCKSVQIASKVSTHFSVSRGGSLIVDEGLDVAYHITLAEIEEATDSFSKQIGEGSFGAVYYGKLEDGKEVAVKSSNGRSIHGNQQFVNEVAILSRIHHRNLVPLIGYCEEGCQRILFLLMNVNFLFSVTSRIIPSLTHSLICWIDPLKQKRLDWLSRLSIAEDAARGLEYLHSGCDPTIIHRDVKTSNILLDIRMKAKVSDFGLSRQADEDLTHVSSVACGTVGYLDPEYYATQKLTDKSDVYSFGVVLLELITGKKPISSEDYGSEWNIVHWARSFVHKGDITSITDPSLEGSFKVDSVWRLAEIAIQSVEPHGFLRPRMQEVVQAIQDAIKIERESIQTSASSPGSSSTRSLCTWSESNPLQIITDDLSSKTLLPSVR
ncbi:hypothetical protein Taro_023806 [Colocasia esculenta]|uniref:Protein kinase domain-containing protein n=1 Tax=Colocasia esculenta TaxID=4460 RepID=A0A843V9G5_COLES|nr:hypothetical protein [Colocasia esculenta]